MFSDTLFRPGAAQNVSFTGTSAQSTALGSQVGAVLISVDQTCFIKLGASPTATTSDTRLMSNTTIGFRVNPGEKIAFIRDTVSGTANITELSR